jgi:aspartate kinase
MSLNVPLNTLRIFRTESMLTLIGVPDIPGSGAELFRGLAARGVPITGIVQNAPDAGSASITFTVPKVQLNAALEVTWAMVEKLGAVGVMNDEHIARLSVSGAEVLEDTVGLAGEFFGVLATERINILAINSTADVISCIIEDANLDQAVTLLRGKFGLSVEAIG